MEKLTPQHPDSIIQSIDYLLPKMEGAKDTYKNYLIKFLNDYAQSKIVGMDAVYVHLALEYYNKGKAPWVEESQLDKIIANAMDAEPTLIGKMAPNLTVQLRDSSDISLYDIDADYLILVFWAHDCGHCKESMPQLKKFYEENQGRGIKVLSVCTKLNKDQPACWDFVDEKELDIWINASDVKGGRSYMHSLFNIKKTPKLFVLNKDKKIISKDLGADQLGAFFDQIIIPSDTTPAKP
jgi:thiol-disulfide isomerase/thioredoxin